MKLIDRVISQYIENRKNRKVGSSDPKRENFLLDLKKSIEEKDKNLIRERIEQQINTISSDLIFQDYNFGKPMIGNSIKDEELQLSLSSPYVKKLHKASNICAATLVTNGKKTKVKNSFFFSFLYWDWSIPRLSDWSPCFKYTKYISMKSVAEKIILLLLRRLTLSIINRPENREKNLVERTSINELITPQNKKLNKEIRELKNKIDYQFVENNTLKADLVEFKEEHYRTINEQNSKLNEQSRLINELSSKINFYHPKQKTSKIIENTIIELEEI